MQIGTSRRKYGMDWPKETDDIFIDLLLAKKWREEPYKSAAKMLAPAEHLLRAARALFTKEQFVISKWTEQHAEDWTTRDFCITWGCAASSKSNDYGLFVLLDWIVDPFDTYTILASTTSDMLQLRSYESVIRYFRTLKQHPRFLIPGKESKQRLSIINEEDADAAEGTPQATLKASIKGVAVQRGTVDEARANLQGVHVKYVRLVADELAQMREAVMDARANLSLGAQDFRFFGLCNPDSIFDLAGRHSIPKSGNWDDVDENCELWETRWGWVRHHNGFKSPAITEPDGEKKFPHLINKTRIDRQLQEFQGNTDAPQIWTMVRGFPPPQGLTTTILSEAELTTFGMMTDVTWLDSGWTVVAGLDPAFTAGGDNCVLQIAKVGYETETKLMVIRFEEPIYIPILASSDLPVLYQIANAVLDQQQKFGFSLANLGVDESGTQSAADVIEMEHKTRYGRFVGTHRVNFNSRPSELPVSSNNPALAKDYYRNCVTELWYTLAEFGKRRQIRMLPQEAARQFCMRRVLPKRPRQLEFKADMKKRLKKSPDEGDSCACLISVVRNVLGFNPGAAHGSPSGGDMNPGPEGFDPGFVSRMNNLDLSPGRYINKNL